MVATPQIRASKELRDIINFVRAKYMLAGKRPPTCLKITQAIAKSVNKEDLLHNEFIKF